MSRSRNFSLLITALLVTMANVAWPTHGAEYQLDRFKVIPLTDTYYSEGANVGDIDGDGIIDAVYGPYWFKGPEFTEKHEIFAAKPQPVEGYANHFFCWIYDFNADGKLDILTAGFPGTPAFVYENPGSAGFDNHWPRHKVLDSVCNESPQLLNIVGDERPELVCTHDGYFGYATIDWNQPFQPWQFHNVSERNAPKPFGHGLGVGDIDGDRRQDIITKDGWFAQPSSLDAGQWEFHPVAFAGPGGAEMYAYDIDGDGDSDIITSLAAHEFGLAWYEQKRQGDRIEFTPHVIMGSDAAANRYGLLFSEPHSVNLADIDGDGLKDIVTGKTYYSHHKQSPLWDAGAVVYWFKLARTKDGIDWIPFRAADDTGIGRQLTVADINGDKLPDMIVGGMKGAHVLLHERANVSRDEWEAAQPKPVATSDKSSAGDK